MEIKIGEIKGELIGCIDFQDANKKDLYFPCFANQTNSGELMYKVNTAGFRNRYVPARISHIIPNSGLLEIDEFIDDILYITKLDNNNLTSILDKLIQKHLSQYSRLQEADFYTLIDEIMIFMYYKQNGSGDQDEICWRELREYGLEEWESKITKVDFRNMFNPLGRM